MNRILQALAGGGVFMLAAALVLLAGSHAPNPAGARVKRVHYVMGTLFEITAYGPDREGTASAIEAAFAAIRRADEIMSHYRPESDLMKLNRSAAGGAVPVPAELYAVLSDSLRYWEISGGAFDVTVAPLVRLWEQSATQGRVPTEAEIAGARRLTGSDAIELLEGDAEEARVRFIRFRREGLEVNLGAIGKGWAVDQAVEVLKNHGVRNALVSAGTSTLYAMGEGETGQGWRVELADPCDSDAALHSPDFADSLDFLDLIVLREGSISTSAATEQYWEINGERYSHILDPRTGRPVEPLRSATVISPTATETDALSTAVYVLGRDEGARLLERLGVRGVLVDDAGGSCTAHRVGWSTHDVMFSEIHDRKANHGN